MIQLGAYVITEELLRTERIVLYRGHHHASREGVLVKVLASQHPSPRDIEGLRHEHAMARQLPIAAVVQPRALEEHGHGLLLVLDDPGGRPLRDLLQGGALALPAALQIGLALAEALAAVHARHVVHKDIQPGNILVDPATLEVRLTGFGLATRLSNEAQPITGLGALDGALAYLAPEQTGRMNRSVDQRSDLYALGVILYEMLTGAPPFAAADAMELMHALLVRPPAPPREIAPGTPAVVSDLVMKLLSKTPEDRYQRAAGAARDLRECLELHRTTGAIRPFPLGRHDSKSGLSIPQRLYGRERDLATLLDAWGRAREEQPELLLVSGYSGIGKSLLVNELQKEIARARGYFISGKFDQLNRSIPYLPLAQAFNGLIHQLLAEHEEVLARYREQILAAVGQSGGVLTDLIPDLSRIIGPQPSLPELSGAAARNRLTLVLQRFLRVFTTAEHPLVLFLDDLQWADLASLELIEVILTAPDRGALLLIGAYRSNEVDAAHPLSRALSRIGASARISAIELGPLGREAVGQLVADALREEPSRTGPLASVVFEKTQGNPFFLIQFLTALHQDGLLAFDADAAAWRYDVDPIRARLATDNASVFMAERIRRLAPETQESLKLGACIGHQFNLKTLSILRGAPRGRVAAALWQAMEEGIVAPTSGDYRFFSAASAEGAEPPPEIDASYRFSHDRVQQAAYSLIRDDEKPALHLQIGRLLSASRGGAPDADLFDVVSHLNLGAGLITAPEERLALARMNLEAGQRARASMAYAEASSYFGKGVSLLGDAGWEQAYDLCFALHRGWAESDALAGGGVAASLYELLCARARTALERAEVHQLRSTFYVMRGRNADAIAESLAGLRLVGVEVHDTEEAWKAAADAETRAVEEGLRGRRIEDLIDAPSMGDPEKEMAMRLLIGLDAPAIGVMPELHGWSCIKAVSLSLRHGTTRASARAYTLYGAVLAHNARKHAEAYAFCKLGVALQDKAGSPGDACIINYSVGGVCHYAEHWRVALAYWERAYAAGLESGDFLFLSYTCSHTAIARLLIGDPLDAVREQTEQFLALMKRTKIATSEAMLTVVRQVIKSLEGRTTGRSSLTDEGFDEVAFREELSSKRFNHALAWYSTAKGILLYLDGDAAAAIPWLTRASQLKTLNFTPEIRFYLCLAILALDGPDGDDARRELEPVLSGAAEELAAWARDGGDNYLHESLLVEAERARVRGEGMRAIALYDQAIAAAQRSELPSGIALASELCARFYLRHGSSKAARAYMTDACYAYARWGAMARIQRLAALFPDLVPVEAQRPARVDGARKRRLDADLLDLDAFLSIQQALSSELVLDAVMERLMRTVLQNAGAERGFLLLEQNGALVIEAAATAAPLEVTVRMGTPLEDSAELPRSIVRYVERLREMVVLADASRDPRFLADPYVSARRPRSIACLSIAHQGRVVGVLYLENNTTANAFTEARVEVLRMLMSQAAISIENAGLYTRLQGMTEELKRANEVLEAEVARRTEALEESNRRLSQELLERQRVQDERAKLQAQVVKAQAERLAELSTPVIPITEGILVMPLIGTVDADRATQIIEAALEGVHRRQARIMILDVTGMKGADAGVAGALLRTAGALELLGAEVVISGVAPSVAEVLVGLDADLSAIVTMATLEDGIRYALSRMGQRWTRRVKRG